MAYRWDFVEHGIFLAFVKVDAGKQYHCNECDAQANQHNDDHGEIFRWRSQSFNLWRLRCRRQQFEL